jgi:hypothetical protein
LARNCDIRNWRLGWLLLVQARKTVTACSLEVTKDSNYPVVILRIAQNKLVDEEEKSKLQSLVDELVTEISAQDKSLWNSVLFYYLIKTSRYNYCACDQTDLTPSKISSWEFCLVQ